MADFKTCLITDSTIADLTDEQVFAVTTGASQNTYQQFQAISTSSSSIVWNIQIPSESIVIDRKALIQSDLTLTLKYSSVAVGSTAYNYGLTDAFAPFPLNSLFTTLSATINNANVSINLQDTLSAMLRLNSSRELNAYNSMCPCLPDQSYLNYSDGILTNNNPLASWNTQSFDNDLAPRGSFPVTSVLYQYDSVGTYVSNSPICATEGNYFLVQVTSSFTEPLFLAPFIFGDPEFNASGMLGVNSLNVVANIDGAARRVFRTASNSTVEISLGTSSNSNPFNNTRMLLNFKSLQPTQIKSSKCVLPYYDYSRYLSSSNNTIMNAGTTATLTSNQFQLNQLPDYFLIMVRKPMSITTIKDTDSWFGINNISINMNNQSGLLSSASQHDLWRMSRSAGSQQSWPEFSGNTMFNNNETGVGTLVKTTGSLLALSPSLHLSLPPFLANGSLGQFSLQFNINVTNNYNESIQPEILLICCNAGVMTLQSGSAAIFTGLLTKSMVLDAQEKSPVEPISSVEYSRMVGGKSVQGPASAMKKIASRIFGRHKSGGASSGGAMSAGGQEDKLSKFY
jgi:hypothetical protein